MWRQKNRLRHSKRWIGSCFWRVKSGAVAIHIDLTFRWCACRSTPGPGWFRLGTSPNRVELLSRKPTRYRLAHGRQRQGTASVRLATRQERRPAFKPDPAFKPGSCSSPCGHSPGADCFTQRRMLVPDGALSTPAFPRDTSERSATRRGLPFSRHCSHRGTPSSRPSRGRNAVWIGNSGSRLVSEAFRSALP